MKRILLAAVLGGFAATTLPAIPSGREPWSIEAMHGPAFRFAVTLDEATWVSLDISPDGKRIVFDILGDLYVVPTEGGEAVRITHGPAYDVQPRFAPDGLHIAFVSDRDGKSNVWWVEPDGANPKALTAELNATLSSPCWTPDGEHLVVSRHDDTQENNGYDLYIYPLGGGPGVKLVDRDKDPLGATVSRDGRWIYFNRTKDPLGASIETLDRQTGATEVLVRAEGGAVRPALSPDGHWLAYGRRMGAEERMVVRDLATGAERVLEAWLDTDQQGNVLRDGDELPGYSFTPDSTAIVYGARGKIHRYDLATNRATVIPFRAQFEQMVHRRLSQKLKIDDGPVRPKLLRWTHESPDGKTLFFSMGGKNYRYDRTDKSVKPIGDGPGFEYSPAVSPDGQWLAYVTWSDDEGGRIYKTSIGHDDPICLVDHAGHYEHLAWSADGSKLVFLRSSGGEFRGEGNLDEKATKDICWITADASGPTHLVTHVKPRGDRREEIRPTFDHRGERIYFTETPVKRQATYFCSIRLDGSDQRRLLKFKFADDVIPSPDEKWVAFTEQFEVYLTPFPAANREPVEVNLEDASRVTKLSSEGGYFVNWAQGGEVVTWGWGPNYYRLALTEAGVAKPSKTMIAFSEPRAIGRGAVLLKGARIITMGTAGVIERGDLLVVDNRIVALGETGRLACPEGTHVVDVTGRTIIPGMIDGHSHYRQSRNPELFPENDWGYVIQLAYGVTTIRDPSARSQSIFSQAEMIEMGRTPGPRVYSTGEPIYFANTAFSRPIKDLDDARLQVRRLKALGATTIKQYVLPRREQRQWLLQAAREEGLMAVPEGSSKTYYDITHLMDGFTTLEHSIKVDALYRDIRALVLATGMYCTPTLIVGYNGSGEDYFYQESDIVRDRKLLHFTPYGDVAPYAMHRTKRPEADFYFRKLAVNAAGLLHEGGNILLGAHGNRPGLGAHWEIWAMAMGGLTPMEALRTATVIPAGALGLEDEIGSLEPGKIADLVVLEKNPLDDIRNTNTVRYVMKSGRMWVGETMDQIWPEQRKFTGFYWRKLKSGTGAEPDSNHDPSG